jgi:hypothetical protein
VEAIAASRHQKSHKIWTKVLQELLHLGGGTCYLLRRFFFMRPCMRTRKKCARITSVIW